MARRQKTEIVEAKAVTIESPMDALTGALKEHTQAIYELGNNIRTSQYAIAYHLYSINTDCATELENTGYADIFDFSNKLFGFEKNYTYKMINVWSHFGLLNADTKETTSLFLTDGKDFSISNLIELNQFDKVQVQALIKAGMISPASTQKQIREVRKAIKDGRIEFYKTGKVTKARYVKPVEVDSKESGTIGSSDSSNSGVGGSSNNLTVDSVTDSGVSTSDDIAPEINAIAQSIFKDFDDFIAANATTYDDIDLYTALVRAETVLASLVNMTSFSVNHKKISDRVVSVAKALDGIRRVLIDDANKKGE